MIRNKKRLSKWENEYRRKEAVTFLHNLRLYEALYEEARARGLFPLKNPLDGLQNKIRLARALNGLKTP